MVYTSWAELRAGIAQSVTIPLDEIRPNPYFQPPDARTGSPIDVSLVEGIAFAPQSEGPGRLVIGTFVLIDAERGSKRQDDS